MKYCINCGNAMGDERFCTKCGADNGTAGAARTDGGAAGMTAGQPLDLDAVISWAMIAMFAVEALIYLIACYKPVGMVMANTMLMSGGIIAAIVYFVIGMWSVIPAVLFAMSGRRVNDILVIGASLITLIIAVLCSIIVAATKNKIGTAGICSTILSPYSSKMVFIIILSVLIIAAGIFRRTKKL